MGSGWVYNATPAVAAQSQYPTILGVTISLTALMTIVMGLRGYVRLVLLKSVGPDDYTILFSAICSIVYNALAIAQSRWGLGLPLKLRPKANTLDYRTLNYAGRPFYMFGITGFKVALCLAYLRIVPPSKKLFKPLIWTVLITCVLAHLAGTLVLILQCSPVRKSLRPDTPGKCLRDDITFYVLAAVTIIYDCIIFLLPIPLLARVQISRRRKVGLIGVFVLGLFTTVCSILRLVQIVTISKNGNSTMLVLWGTIEMNVGIILTCIPTLTPLFKYFRNRTTKQGGYGYGYEGYPDGHGTYESGSSRTATEHPLEYMPGKGASSSGHHHTHDHHHHRGSAMMNSASSGGAGDRRKRGVNYRPRGEKGGIEAETSSQESILGIESAQNGTTNSGAGGVDWPPQSSGEIEIEKGLNGGTIHTTTYDVTRDVASEGRRKSDGGIRGGMLGGHVTDQGFLVGHGTPNGGITRTTDVDVEISHLDTPTPSTEVVVDETGIPHVRGTPRGEHQLPLQQPPQVAAVGMAVSPGIAR
ncbi:MAG: swr1 complex component [Watsoniomyces obsoletus]|nr:MAG: swr1 complex component [Watsoniomyces obsoletus]